MSKLITGQGILSELCRWDKYSQHVGWEDRKENWDETVYRVKEMHLSKYPHAKAEIDFAMSKVYSKEVSPSMRSLQFGGECIERNPTKVFNCSFHHISELKAFRESMYLLLCGSGVGFSVQKHHVAKLPPIKGCNYSIKRRYRIADSIEGWADALDFLLKSYTEERAEVVFDYSDIRPRGSIIKSTGAEAPGPEKLMEALENIRKILTNASGRKLNTIEAYDIVCYSAECVRSGGIRRSALICLFSLDDQDMLLAKSGTWYLNNAQRAMSNNSMILLRGSITKNRFLEIIKEIENNKSGEPGIYWTNNLELGTNPCVEISLKNRGFCNLTSQNMAVVRDQNHFNELCRASAILGTIQASYTDFIYLSEDWKQNADEEALLGCSMTGICDNIKTFYSLDLKEGAKIILDTNEKLAKKIGIRPTNRGTAIKPEGTNSLFLGGVAPGAHSQHDPFFIRRFTLDKPTALYKYLMTVMPELIEDSLMNKDQAYFCAPISVDKNKSVFRDEPMLDMLNRVKYLHDNWIKGGHVIGENTHNVSATVSVKAGEWDILAEWMWDNQHSYSGIALLPYEDSSYPQLIYQTIDEATFLEKVKHLKPVNLDEVKILAKDVNLVGELACAGGACLV